MTPKQTRFVQEYLIDLNATQAAIRAGYSARTAALIGCQNIRKLQIAAAISAAQALRAERTEVTQDMVVRGMHREAQYEGEGASHGARVAAWGHLSKHTGGFSEKVEHKGEFTFEAIRRVIVKAIP